MSDTRGYWLSFPRSTPKTSLTESKGRGEAMQAEKWWTISTPEADESLVSSPFKWGNLLKRLILRVNQVDLFLHAP